MEKSFALPAADRDRDVRPDPTLRSPAGHRTPACIVVLLLGLMAWQTTVPSVARAASTEKRLLSITKTTVYGALLGGVLGLASALVVREGYEDDAIRWGVAVGAFSGFIFGALSPEESDEFSLGRRSDPGALARLDDFRGSGSDRIDMDAARDLHPRSARLPAIGGPLVIDHGSQEVPEGVAPASLHGVGIRPKR